MLEKYVGNADVVIVPSQIDQLPVRIIAENCFDGHVEILKVVLPDTVRTIEYRAFYGCSHLREMNFPDGLKEIGEWCFSHTAIPKVMLPDSVKKLGDGAFYSCTKLETVVLSPNVQALGEDTFRKCVRLKSVTIPSERIDIDIKAFEEKCKATIIGVPGSYAERYAKAMGIHFEPIEQ